MGKVKNLIKDIDTSAMSPEELKEFIAEELAPAMKKEWGDRGYKVYLNAKKDVVYAPFCRKCRSVSERYAVLIPVSEEIKKVRDIESIVCTDSADYLDDKDYLDFCNCVDEEYSEVMSNQSHSPFEELFDDEEYEIPEWIFRGRG